MTLRIYGVCICMSDCQFDEENPESESHVDCKSHLVFSDVKFQVKKKCDL